MSNFQKGLIIVFLCVAVIFISGVLLPKYFSSQILELRNELNSQDANSKYNLQTNLAPVAEKYTRDENKASVSNRNIKTAERFQSALAKNSIQSPMKVKKRSIRRAMSKDEHYTWNFHFNLSQQQNDSQEKTEIALNTSRKDKLDISIYNEGEGNRQKTSADIQLTLGLALDYFRELFKYVENIKEDTKNELPRSEEFDFSTLHSAGSSDKLFIRERDGKFINVDILSLFGIGKFPKKKILSSTVSTRPKTDSVIIEDDFMRTTQTDIFIENSQKMPNFSNVQAQSLVSEALSLVRNTSGSNFSGKAEGECIDCNAVGFELPINSSIESLNKNSSSKPVISSNEFEDEFLEMFCMRLVKEAGLSQHSSNTEDIIIEPKQNKLNDHTLKLLGNSQFDSLPSSVSEKELNLDIFSENAITSSNTSGNEKRQKKFLSLDDFLAMFGSGRAAADEDESNELTMEVFADGNLERLPTLLDCKNYFREKNTKMFAKPNLMDMLSDPKIQLADFANTTVSSKLVEQQLQFLTDLLKTNLGNSVETFAKNSDGAVTKSASASDTGSGALRFLESASDTGSGDSFKNFTDQDLRSISSKSDNLLEDHNLGNKDCRENCLYDVSVDASNEHNKIEANSTVLKQIETDNLTAESIQRSFSSNEFFEDVSFSNLPKNESEKLTESVLDCLNCNPENLTKINESSEAIGASSKCADCTECNIGEKCNSSISHISDESEQILPAELEEIYTNRNNINERIANENLKTSSNTTSANIDFHTGEGSIDSSTQNVIESPNEQQTENTERFFRPIILTGSGDGGFFRNRGGLINLEEEENMSVDTTDDHPDNKNIYSSTENIIEKLNNDDTTERNTRRILVLLTGSGDGGPINLVQEERKFQNASLRQSRFDDAPLNFSEVLHENSLKQSEQGPSVYGNRTTEKFTSPFTTLKRGRADDTLDHICDDCDYDYADLIENLKNNSVRINNSDNSNFKKRIGTQFNSEMPITKENKNTATVSSEVIRNYSQFDSFTKEFKIQSRPCAAARECNATLNERCITMNSSRVCGCSRGYARNKETRKCIVKKVVETSIKLPAENFEEDLKNPFSSSFQNKKKSSLEMIKILLQNDPELLRHLSEIEIIEFSAGSLVITLNLVFAVENKSEAQLVKDVEDDIQIGLRDERIVNSISLDISKASLISVNGDIDYCKSSELNYCSDYAKCVPNRAIPGSYTCHCKEHYRDVSFDPRRTGEACLAKCPQEYCGSYGHCELLANDERLCLCSGLYFGRRCEVPGLYILIVLGFVGFVSITMLLLVVFKRRCSKFSYSETQSHGTEENEAHSHMNGRVSDAIALEENIGRKFTNISTPMPQPAIIVTRPTTNGSGSSYDFDSTFDSTPGSRKIAENTTV